MTYHLLHMRAVYLLLIHMVNTQTPLINQLTLDHKIWFMCSATLHVSTNFNNTSLQLVFAVSRQVWPEPFIKEQH